jgi:hypothetical protein
MYILRIVLCCLLLASALMTPLWFFILFVIGYVVLFGAIEPVLIAILIDAQFGGVSHGMAYLYTLCTLGIVCIVHAVRPFLRL